MNENKHEQPRVVNKKHSENADTSTSVIFDLVVWPWPYVKVKKADGNRWRFLYYTLVPKTASKSVSSFRLEFFSQALRHTHRQTDIQTNCNKNITPPWFCKWCKKIKEKMQNVEDDVTILICRQRGIWQHCRRRKPTFHIFV